MTKLIFQHLTQLAGKIGKKTKKNHSIVSRDTGLSVAAVFIIVLILIVEEFCILPAPIEQLTIPHQNLRISDGDTISDGKNKIRFYGIDAPELAQYCKDNVTPCGQKSYQFLVFLTNHQDLNCKIVEKDKYGRKIGICFDIQGNDLNQAMIANGYAIFYSQYSIFIPYFLAELSAYFNNKGLYGYGWFEEPEKWRKKKKLKY